MKKVKKRARFHTSASGVKAGGENKISGKTRRRLPSEALSQFLFSRLYDTGRSQKKGPQSLGGGGLKSNTPKIISGQEQMFLQAKAEFPSLTGLELKQSKEQICKDRQTRREVLFAKKKAGKIKVQDAQWTFSSLVRCN